MIHTALRRHLPLLLMVTTLCSCARNDADRKASDTAATGSPAPAAKQAVLARDGATEHPGQPGTWKAITPGADRMSQEADLDGDGRPERIDLTLRTVEGITNFSVAVNGVTAQDSLPQDNNNPEIGIIDLDTADRTREVVVYARGLSDFDSYTFYGYRGGKLRKIGDLYDRIRYTGDGSIVNSMRMGFWFRQENYRYTSGTGTLRHLPQQLYDVGVTGTVARSFPLYKARGSKEVVAELKPGSKAVIVSCEYRECKEADDQCLWYLIKTGAGTTGWKQGIFDEDFTDLPWAG